MEMETEMETEKYGRHKLMRTGTGDGGAGLGS